MPRLTSVFLTSIDVARTAAFYRDVAQLDLELRGEAAGYQYWRHNKDGMQIAIHGAEAFADYAHPPVPASNVTHLYFNIDDCDAFLAHLVALGIVPTHQDDVVITLLDPDGRHVMFGTA